MKKVTFAFLVFGLTSLQAVAAPRTSQQMKQAAAKAINAHRSSKRMAPRTDALKVLKSTSTYEILGYEKGGFAVISADDLEQYPVDDHQARPLFISFRGGASAHHEMGPGNTL